MAGDQPSSGRMADHKGAPSPDQPNGPTEPVSGPNKPKSRKARWGCLIVLGLIMTPIVGIALYEVYQRRKHEQFAPVIRSCMDVLPRTGNRIRVVAEIMPAAPFPNKFVLCDEKGRWFRLRNISSPPFLADSPNEIGSVVFIEEAEGTTSLVTEVRTEGSQTVVMGVWVKELRYSVTVVDAASKRILAQKEIAESNGELYQLQERANRKLCQWLEENRRK